MKKILIIDDDPVIRKYLASLLNDNGYATDVAQNAREAMDLVSAESFDLITLDLDMPGEWGTRFFSKLAQDKVKKNIPVIVISGMSGNEYAIPKAVASLTKPFDQKELLKIVRDVLK
ncbi:MAG: response regulator [Proteobacteria bacterium]|nr:response regulator [Pseudomonadota bacterium]MBU1581215.1 response regulator [Pseudomonadota bacterium]MBU2452864.1 response regulator [Pseudomonadota bacterium]MBU2631263.1 response regulator [Pseudomonadota bacterium]